eukprot:6492627-Amphidinium_carterae.2
MRELLPLPHVHVEGVAASHLSRVVRQRAGRRRAIANRTNEAIEALNWLADSGSTQRDASAPTEVQKQAQEFIRSRVLASPASLAPFEAEATARSLLGSGQPYDVGSCSVAPLDLAQLSIPKAGSTSVDLISRLPSESADCLQHPEEHMLVTPDEWGRVCEKHDHVNVYNDPRLRDRKTYLALVERLYECNLIAFVPAREVVSRVGVFTVYKKDRRQRMILDCRATNKLFRVPPRVGCGTGA